MDLDISWYLVGSNDSQFLDIFSLPIVLKFQHAYARECTFNFKHHKLLHT